MPRHQTHHCLRLRLTTLCPHDIPIQADLTARFSQQDAHGIPRTGNIEVRTIAIRKGRAAVTTLNDGVEDDEDRKYAACAVPAGYEPPEIALDVYPQDAARCR